MLKSFLSIRTDNRLLPHDGSMGDSSSGVWWRYLEQDKIIYGIKIPSFS